MCTYVCIHVVHYIVTKKAKGKKKHTQLNASKQSHVTLFASLVTSLSSLLAFPGPFASLRQLRQGVDQRESTKGSYLPNRQGALWCLTIMINHV